jgi:hypothetical protein
LFGRVAGADPITLNVQGTLSSVIFTPFGFPIAIGDPFRLDITFNPPKGDVPPAVEIPRRLGDDYAT